MSKVERGIKVTTGQRLSSCGDKNGMLVEFGSPAKPESGAGQGRKASVFQQVIAETVIITHD
jgi:hypothetical protein